MLSDSYTWAYTQLLKLCHILNFPTCCLYSVFSRHYHHEISLAIGPGLYFNFNRKSMMSKGSSNGNSKALRKCIRIFFVIHFLVFWGEMREKNDLWEKVLAQIFKM